MIDGIEVYFDEENKLRYNLPKGISYADFQIWKIRNEKEINMFLTSFLTQNIPSKFKVVSPQ